ncbi:hypothetical protein ACH0B6_16940 [Solibacillus silvestris]
MSRSKMLRKKNKRLTIEQIQTTQTAYFKSLTFKDYFSHIAFPAFLFAIFAQVLFYYWQITVGAAVLGALIGFSINLPNTVRMNYKKRSYLERNRLINSMTQLLVNPDYTVLQVFKKITPRLEGELKQDIDKLMATLSVGSNMEVRIAFQAIIDKYNDDIIFGQFMEQIETSHFEGNNDVGVLKDIKTHHNEVLEKQANFLIGKNRFLGDFKGLTLIMLVLIGMISIIFSIEKYIQYYAHHLTGWITIPIFLVVSLYAYLKIKKIYYDDSVTEVR